MIKIYVCRCGWHGQRPAWRNVDICVCPECGSRPYREVMVDKDDLDDAREVGKGVLYAFITLAIIVCAIAVISHIAR